MFRFISLVYVLLGIFLQNVFSMECDNKFEKNSITPQEEFLNFVKIGSVGDVENVLSNTDLKTSININEVDSDGGTPLFYAILFQNPNIAKLLIKKGANPNNGISPLSISASILNELNAIENEPHKYLEFKDLFLYLINNGARVDYKFSPPGKGQYHKYAHFWDYSPYYFFSMNLNSNRKRFASLLVMLFLLDQRITTEELFNKALHDLGGITFRYQKSPSLLKYLSKEQRDEEIENSRFFYYFIARFYKNTNMKLKQKRTKNNYEVAKILFYFNKYIYQRDPLHCPIKDIGPIISREVNRIDAGELISFIENEYDEVMKEFGK